ncbi:MAG: hypothetical protein ACE5JU_04780 [Candidatus Binatia bacterium]
MQRPWKGWLLILVVLCLMLNSREARAKWGYMASGNMGTGFRYTRETHEGRTTWNFERTNNYTLGLQGKILDPRLATFNISGAISTNDPSSNRGGAQSSQLYSFRSNLTLLSGKNYPLDLRFSRSHSNSDTDTDVTSFGGTWRIVYGALPSIALSFDQVSAQSTGETRADTTFMTGTLKLVKRLSSSDMEAEFGFQNFTDDIRSTSRLGHFGRFSDTTRWSQATTLRFLGNYFFQEGSRSIGTAFSLINRPDPTLSRSFSFGIRNAGSRERGETTVDANGSLSKAFQPFESLSMRYFTRTGLSQRFPSDGTGNSTQISWSQGASLVSSYFRAVLATAGYGLGLSYAHSEEGESNLSRGHQFQVGLESRTLAPYRVRGDYTFTLQQTETDRTAHSVSLRADGPIRSTLFFRSYARFFNVDVQSSDEETNTSTRQRTLTLGSALTYTGIRQMYLNLGANASRSESESNSNWVTQLTANLSYHPRSRLTLMLDGLRETSSSNDLTRYEIRSRVIYRFGRVTVNFEHRFQSHVSFAGTGQGHSISISINRPFRFSF